MKKLFLFIIIFGCSLILKAQVISTYVGNGTASYTGDNGPSTAATMSHAYNLTHDFDWNLYFGDHENSCIRKVSSTGIITTIAGSGYSGFYGDGGPATDAAISNTVGIYFFNPTKTLYFSDFYNQRVRKIDSNGIITTIAGIGSVGLSGDNGPASAAELYYPGGITCDNIGNIYIADEWNNRIREIDTFGIITTIAGNGPTGFFAGGYGGDGGSATAALVNFPLGITYVGGNLFFTDAGNNCVRKINSSGIITTIAGNGTVGYSGDFGPATNAHFNTPDGIAVTPYGEFYIGDFGNHAVRIVDTFGIIKPYAGTGVAGYSGDGGPPTAAQLNLPTGISIDEIKYIFICDNGNNRIRMICTTCEPVGNKDKFEFKQLFNVSPNPNTGSFILNLNFIPNSNSKVYVNNVLGQKVLDFDLLNKNQVELKINTKGQYVVHVISPFGNDIEKILVE